MAVTAIDGPLGYVVRVEGLRRARPSWLDDKVYQVVDLGPDSYSVERDGQEIVRVLHAGAPEDLPVPHVPESPPTQQSDGEGEGAGASSFS